MTSYSHRARVALQLAAAFLLTSFAGICRLEAEEITVYAAAGLSNVLDQLGPEFKRATGHDVKCNLGSSGLLARQIQEGAPADVFFPADELRLNQVDAAGLLTPGTRRSVVVNTLVLVVAKGQGLDWARLSALSDARVRRIAIGQTDTVPAGAYAKGHLVRIGLWERLSRKMLPLDNVRAVLAAVEAGNADAGFVYRTDVLGTKESLITLELPPPDGPKIIFPAAAIKTSKHPEAARAFLDFLQSAEAQKSFARFGFIPVH